MIKYIVILSSVLGMSFIQTDKKVKHYIAFGDSYTICTGTSGSTEHWPDLLAGHLTKEGIATQLIANPSRNGYSTQNVIDNELPLLKANTCDFATLLIGVNDWVRGVDVTTYHKNLNHIIDEVQKVLPDKSHLLLITIPDFGVTPRGTLYGGERHISAGITEFNNVIKAEAKKRGLACVDIFPLSKGMLSNKELVAADGLHPSAKEYALWEALIFAEAKKLLAK